MTTLKNPQDFIVCPDTNLSLNKPVVGLVKIHILTAVVMLLAGGLLGYRCCFDTLASYSSVAL